MNLTKSMFFAVMSLGLVGTTSVARADQEASIAESVGALRDEEATEDRIITESDEALTSQPADYNPYDYDAYRRHGGRSRCLDFCREEYFRCERYDDRFRRHGYPGDRFRRHGRCQSEYNFCARRVCREHRFGDFGR
ncbi:hypothetical protein [Polyangium sp. 6x1]|uniref:hypothetical protein n=1 Tax=Polyangium sp. 6x1 TaxID=3042689 RepID=UPI0024826998|nr:hypothetical protein [Polyangium sp. 6x1]MDI1444087.1 hypothetical protein [Polyangium sp. 6x1]